MDIYTHYY